MLIYSSYFSGDLEYFEWHWQTGAISLKRNLDKPIGYIFELRAVASDSGNPKQSTSIGKISDKIVFYK